MRISKCDKVVTIRFNLVEQKILDYILINCSAYYDEPVGSVIKRILTQEYKRKSGDQDLDKIL